MLLKKLAELADSLDARGYHDEAAQVDEIMRFIAEGAKKMKCKCKCAKCKKKGEVHVCECSACADDKEMCACC